MDKYSSMPLVDRNMIRDSYWSALRERLKFTKSILVSNTPEPDSAH